MRFQEERYVHLPSSSVYRECDDELRLQVQGTVDVASLLSEYLFPSWQDMEGWSWCKKKQKHGDSSVPVANRKIRKSIAEYVRLAFQKKCNTVTVMLGWVCLQQEIIDCIDTKFHYTVNISDILYISIVKLLYLHYTKWRCWGLLCGFAWFLWLSLWLSL